MLGDVLFLMAPHYWAPKYEVTESGTENNFLILKEAAHSRAPPGGPQDEAAVSRKVDRSAEVLEATDPGAQKRVLEVLNRVRVSGQ